ncbi:uncharacterized protein CcaverHIS019_0207510 [Cutaneotrichosporon cavernicola]|uniref:Uncharacterized protein n=1 Tax=Cutaneotrichosporon cavernicola TaxID=279322 RepID=A0AA48KYG9_9TREE|nr:uncharacterized protein CcaverHIS019_0207510 [Cutaneotrichosporon cavernicola]BEI89389.1 hypothetical protein CcaverHIS019_0207510 [Cutaneotrichosporon cavernicola]BEJ04937.1 hypothetical protein CcaverHIS641_0207540 [Cutaneotrichosporon cavernicola]
MNEHPSFSRLALAAALIEYDNDIDDPYKEYIDHRTSAVFRQFTQQRRAPSLPPLVTRGQGFAGVGAGKGTALPLPPGSAARSTFSAHSGDMPPDIPPDVNIDLDDWDLPEHMVSEEAKLQHMSPANPLSPSHPPSQPLSPLSPLANVPGAPDYPPSPAYASPSYGPGSPRDATFAAEAHGASARAGHGRTISEVSMPVHRPRSIHLESISDNTQEYMDEMPGRHSLDAYGAEADAAVRGAGSVQSRPSADSHNRRQSILGHLNLEDDYGRPAAPIMVRLPDSPTSERFGRPVGSRPPVPRSPEGRAPSRGLVIDEQDILANAFEMPGPPPELGARFTPGGLHRLSLNLEQIDSHSDSGRPARRPSLVYLDRPDSVASGPPGSFYGPGSEVDAGSPTRPVFDDIPTAEEYGRPLRPAKYNNQAYRMARHQLLRPKTLIMPSVLEGTERPTATVHIPEGFTLGEKPLPEDARASILNQGKGVPLSLAQRTFASSLMVGGARDDDFFQGQAAEGEVLPGGLTEEERFAVEQERRQPGKLYGTSLIDQLEARKTALSNKKRVFYGDNRPSMMARSTQSAFLAPPGQGPPDGDPGQRPMSYAPGGSDRPISMAVNDPRPKSYAPGVPALNLPDEDAEEGDLGTANRTRNVRSVFGTDMVWEREMAKLRELQLAQARANEEEDVRKHAKEEAKQAKIDARESKMYHTSQRKSLFGVGSGNSRKSMLNPEFVPENDPNFVRPMSIAFGPGGMIIPTGNEDTGDESDDEGESDRPYDASPRTSRDRPPTVYSDRPATTYSDRPPTHMLDVEGPELTSRIFQPPAPALSRRSGSRLGAETWYRDSDDDEDMPLSRSKGRPAPAPIQVVESGYESDSEEDVPLSRLKVVDSDEELPLSQLRKGPAVGTPTTATSATVRPKSGAPSLPVLGDLANFDITPTSPLSPPSGRNSPPVGASAGLSGDEDEDEDEVPLFVRKARQRASQPKTKEEIEDDLPLGWKHAGGGSNRTTQMTPSFYQQPGMPYSPYGPAMGMGGMGMGGMGMGMGMMPMNMGSQMMPMSPMGPMLGAPMPYQPGQPGLEMPDPGSNIDRWRQNVSGRAGSVASSAPSHVGR